MMPQFSSTPRATSRLRPLSSTNNILAPAIFSAKLLTSPFLPALLILAAPWPKTSKIALNNCKRLTGFCNSRSTPAFPAWRFTSSLLYAVCMITFGNLQENSVANISSKRRVVAIPSISGKHQSMNTKSHGSSSSAAACAISKAS